MAGFLSFAVPATLFPGVLGAMRDPDTAEVLELTGWYLLLAVELWGLLLVIGYALQRTRLASRYAPAGVVLGACVAAALVELSSGRADLLIEEGVVQSSLASHAQGFIASIIMALLFFAHLQRSRAQEQGAARLAAAQIAQRQVQRRLAQARLQAVQARIDPHFLFQMLDEIRRAYEEDAGRAERLLDELVTFLRAALPRLRSSSSDVLREVHLARAYAQLCAVARGADIDMTVDVAADVAHARFPPGVLLPLLDGALRVKAASCALIGTRSFDACELVLTLPARPLEETVAGVRSLLSDLYGATARLAIAAEDGFVRVVVKVPYEHA